LIGGTEGAVSPPPRPSGSLAAFRRELENAGFTAAGVRQALGVAGSVLAEGPGIVGQERRLASAPPVLAGLIRLLVLEREIESAALTPGLIDGLIEHGLASEDGEALHTLVRIVPHNQLLVASDTLHTSTPEHVAAVHRPSAMLANLTVRRHVKRCADVATGNGVQALLCASHCEHVVATDVNERALGFAAFNAALNGIANVEFRAGSFFEPVAGERFDLLVCNPPYVISPETSLIFRDSGLPGDAVSAQLAAELPDLLAADGFGTILISWAADEDDETARPRGWVDGRGCDAWLLRAGSDDPLTAAVGWNKQAGDLEERRQRVDAWLEYYERLGIRRIAYGGLVLHRRDGRDHWFRSEAMPPDMPEPASEQLLRLFAADTDGLLDRPVSLVPTAVVQRAGSVEDGAWRFVSATVESRDGVALGVNLDPVGSALVDCLDGRAPLRERLPELASRLGVPEDKLTQFAETLVRHLVERGLAV
jgi:methyltransferase family protein